MHQISAHCRPFHRPPSTSRLALALRLTRCTSRLLQDAMGAWTCAFAVASMHHLRGTDVAALEALTMKP